MPWDIKDANNNSTAERIRPISDLLENSAETVCPNVFFWTSGFGTYATRSVVSGKYGKDSCDHGNSGRGYDLVSCLIGVIYHHRCKHTDQDTCQRTAQRTEHR